MQPSLRSFFLAALIREHGAPPGAEDWAYVFSTEVTSHLSDPPQFVRLRLDHWDAVARKWLREWTVEDGHWVGRV